MGASASTLGQLSLGGAAYDYISSTLGKRGTIIEHNGLRGTRSRHGGRTRQGIYTVGGTIVMEPSPEELATLLPKILGANASGTTYALAETIPEFDIIEDKIAKVATYEDCKVNRATFTSGENQPLRLSLDIVGKTESIGAAGSLTGLSHGNTGPFVFHDTASGVTLSGTGSRAIKSFSLTIDNMILAPFNNSQTASFLVAGDRMVSLSLTTPWSSDETDLYDQAAAGAAATITFSYANYSLSFALANLQVPAETPGNPGRGGEMVLSVGGLARMASTTKELIVTLDSTA